MEIDWGTILDKVPELGMVVVFVYFALTFVKQGRETSKLIMDQWREFFTSQQNEWRMFVKEQQIEWRDALKDQDSLLCRQLDKLTAITLDNSTKLSEHSSSLTTLITAIDVHDSRVEHHVSDILHKDEDVTKGRTGRKSGD